MCIVTGDGDGDSDAKLNIVLHCVEFHEYLELFKSHEFLGSI